MIALPDEFTAAVAAQAASRFDEARAGYQRVLTVSPNHAEALHRLASLHLTAREFDAALAPLERCVILAPREAAVRYDLGLVYQAQGKIAEASGEFQQALFLRPRFAEAHFALGSIYRGQGYLTQAIAAFHNALNLRPSYLEARCALGGALIELRDYPSAANVLRMAYEAAPEHPDALGLYAIVLAEIGPRQEATALCEKAIALHPDRPAPHVALGNLHDRADRQEAAMACFRRAIEVSPGYLPAYCNLANGLAAQHRYAESLAVFAEAGARYPNSGELSYNRSLVQLATGDFAAGWASYDSRSILGQGRAIRQVAAPYWEGDISLQGRTILLHCEQGLGDTIQSLRYVPLVAAAGALVYLAVQAEIQSLCASLTGVHKIIAIGEPLPVVDLHCALLSLPRAFGTRLETIPSAVPYLLAPPTKIAEWRALLGPGPKVGLVWSGNPEHHNDRHRSLTLADFSTVTRDARSCRYISLQKNPRPTDAALLADLRHIEDFTDRLGDLADTAALIVQLDLVITVDTAIAHLAGALGVPVWVLVPYNSDWRWLVDRTDSPWYPTMRLFRKAALCDWRPTLEELREQLNQHAAARFAAS